MDVRQLCVQLLAHGGGVDLAKCLLDPEPDKGPTGPMPPWCICGLCRPMPTEVEENAVDDAHASHDTNPFIM